MARVNLSAVADLPLGPYHGDGHRQQAPHYDPLSGEGARRRGGRFNPPASFPTLYLCSTRACAVAEFFRMGSRHAIGPGGLLPRHLFRYTLRLDRVIDLTVEENLGRLGISPKDLVIEDLSVTRSIGEAAYASGIQAVRSPSATGKDDILAVFVETLGAELIAPMLQEVWSTLEDVEE